MRDAMTPGTSSGRVYTLRPGWTGPHGSGRMISYQFAPDSGGVAEVLVRPFDGEITARAELNLWGSKYEVTAPNQPIYSAGPQGCFDDACVTAEGLLTTLAALRTIAKEQPQ